MKTLCLSYLITLSWLLLAGTPARLLQAAARLCEPLYAAATVGHFLGFLLLTILALTPRWIVPRWAILTCLLAAALGTELLQQVIPHRVSDVADGLLNLAGIATGAAICGVAATIKATKRWSSEPA